MKTLSIDIETFSSVNLAKSGVYRYSESEDFEILLFGYSVDGGPVEVVDFTAGEKLPASIKKALTDDSVMKWAFNAQFERYVFPDFSDIRPESISTRSLGIARWFGPPPSACHYRWRVSVRSWGWRSRS